MHFQSKHDFFHTAIKSNLVYHIIISRFVTFQQVSLNGICSIIKKVKSNFDTSNVNNMFLQNLLWSKCMIQAKHLELFSTYNSYLTNTHISKTNHHNHIYIVALYCENVSCCKNFTRKNMDCFFFFTFSKNCESSMTPNICCKLMMSWNCSMMLNVQLPKKNVNINLKYYFIIKHNIAYNLNIFPSHRCTHTI